MMTSNPNITKIPVPSVPVSSISTPTLSQNSLSLVQPADGQASLKSQTKGPAVIEVLTKQRLQDLVHEVDPHVQNDDEVEELLLKLAEDFIDDVVDTSCVLAKHRGSFVLEVKDVQLSLEKGWNMWIPGFGCEELRPYKKSALTEAHKQRMALIRKAKK